MNTPSTPQAITDPPEDALRRLAFERRSCNFGTGGRFVTPPSQADLESVTGEEIEGARRYFRANAQNLLHLCHATQ